MSKVKIANKKRFITFIVVCVLVLTAVIAGIVHLAGEPADPASCNHKWKDGVCKRCGISSNDEAAGHEHQWDAESGLCSSCGYACPHPVSKKGVCATCGYYDPDYTPADQESWPSSSTALDSYPVSDVTEDYLILVNREYHLTSSYVPSDLIAINEEYRVSGVGSVAQKTNCLRIVAATAFNKMAADAASEGVSIKMRTGYRSYSYQESLYASNVASEGEEEANKSSAKPGQSEHQLGLALDIAGESDGYMYTYSFLSTREGRWVKKHCAEYGFIIRYSDGSSTEVGQYTGYLSEPWHLRYVGVEAATIITENKLTLEQYFDIIAEYQ